MISIKDAITVDQAIDWLSRNGIIDSPDYWRLVSKTVEHLDELLIKVVKKFSYC